LNKKKKSMHISWYSTIINVFLILFKKNKEKTFHNILFQINWSIEIRVFNIKINYINNIEYKIINVTIYNILYIIFIYYNVIQYIYFNIWLFLIIYKILKMVIVMIRT